MKVKIKGKEFELHYSMRIHILYENVMNQALGNNDNVGNTTSMVALMYCAIMASMQYYKINETLTYDEFMDWIDQQGPSVFIDFGKWFSESVETFNAIGSNKDEKSGKKGSAKKDSPNA